MTIANELPLSIYTHDNNTINTTILITMTK